MKLAQIEEEKKNLLFSLYMIYFEIIKSVKVAQNKVHQERFSKKLTDFLFNFENSELILEISLLSDFNC